MIRKLLPHALPPFAVPTLFGLWFATSAGGEPPMAFLLGFVLAAAVCFPVYLFIYAPVLFLATRAYRPTGARVTLIGGAAGLAAVLPFQWLCYASSGPDSGPPVDTFAGYLADSATDPFLLLLPVSGLLTALLHWALWRGSD